MISKLNYAQAHQKIITRFCQSVPTRGIQRLMRELSLLVDIHVKKLWNHEVHHNLPLNLQKKATLIAIGGYGRSELLPNSDVDLLVLLSSDLTIGERAQINMLIERWVAACWDFGLTISHSLRTIDETILDSADDLSIQTSLLESRLLIGSAIVYSLFHEKFQLNFDLQQFSRAKIAEMRTRHARFDDTPYSLEPNCKEAPGGLRDLHLMIWLAKSAHLGKNWDDLQKNNWLSMSQLKLITRSENCLLSIRAHLHIISHRPENRVLFDLQSQLAAAFNMTDSKGKRASEQLMQRYYLAARAVHQQCTLFLQKFKLHLSPPMATHLPNHIDGFDGLTEVNHMLDITHDDIFIKTPSLLIDIFYVYGRTAGLTGFSAQLWEAILKSRNLITPVFRRNPQHKAKFLRLLQLESGITHAIRLMNQTGILGRYLPPFRKIIGQMQHDLFHIYTVDQHILTVMRYLRRFTMTEHIAQHPMANQIMSEFNQPWLLYIAALFHDIAKGRGGNHSELGAVEVARFAKSHDLTPEQTDLLVFLIKHHLTMSAFAQKEDLSNPEIISRFAQIVNTRTKLQALYLLTIADIRGTSPKVWNAWKDKLLSNLFLTTQQILSSNSHIQILNQTDDRKNTVLQALPVDLQNGAQRLWQSFDVEYFLRHDVTTITWHARAILKSPHQTHVAVQLFNDQRSLQVMVYTQDKNDLFARLCSFFQQRQWSIFDAQIYTSVNRMALDTIQVTLPETQTTSNIVIQQLETELRNSLEKASKLPTPNLGRLSARSRSFPITPSMSLMSIDENKYLLKLTATDRSGVLYHIASVLKKLNIKLISARIVTLGERFEDVFILSSEQLAHPAIVAQLEIELVRVCTIKTTNT